MDESWKSKCEEDRALRSVEVGRGFINPGQKRDSEDVSCAAREVVPTKPRRHEHFVLEALLFVCLAAEIATAGGGWC